MINLIPPKAKKDLLVEYWIRVLSVWTFLISAGLAIGAVLLIPVYVFTGTLIETNSENFASATTKVEEFRGYTKAIDSANRKAVAAINESNSVSLTSILQTFKSIETEDVTVTQLSVSRLQDGFGPTKIAGIAKDRVSLAAFRDKIFAEDIVEEVDLPISNLAKDKDIQFVLDVSIKSIKDHE